MKIKILLVIVSFILIGLTAQFVIPFDLEIEEVLETKQQGVCWVGGRDKVSLKELEPLVKRNITWISQTPFAWQSDPATPEIRLNIHADKVWWGESDQGIAETTQMANYLGIKTLLKPHLWIRGSWPGEVNMSDEKNWSEWFSHYEKFILHYAELAETNDIEIFCIGTELTHASKHELAWRSLIAKIRDVYSGKLTYAANFNQEYEHIKFWDALDFIGIQAYFSLSQKRNPTTEELITNWTTHLQAVEKIQKKFSKPVLFTEIGYRSTEDAAIEPWKWPQENKMAASSAETQAKCYEAFFKTAWKKPWLQGAYFWKWYPQGIHSLNEIDFTPQGKLAEKVLLENFRK